MDDDAEDAEDAGDEAGNEPVKDAAASPAWPWAVVALLLVVAAMRPFAPWVGELPGLSTLIFPTRLHLPATVAAALAGGLALSRLGGSLRGWLPLAVVALLAWDSVPYLGSPKLLPELPEEGMVHYRDGEATRVDLPATDFLRLEEAFLPPADYGRRIANLRRVYGEYQPRELWDGYFSRWSMWPQERKLSELLGAELRFLPYLRQPIRLDPEPYARWVTPGNIPRPLEWMRSRGAIRVELPPDHGGGWILLTEMAYPGWRLRLDGSPPRHLERRPGEPLLAADVTPGARIAVFSYEHFAPWYRKLALFLSLGSLLVFSVGLVRLSRSDSQPATESSS